MNRSIDPNEVVNEEEADQDHDSTNHQVETYLGEKYIRSEAICFNSLFNRKILKDEGVNISQYSVPFSEVFRNGVFAIEGIDRSALEEKFAALPEEARRDYAEAEVNMIEHLVESKVLKDRIDYMTRGYDTALKVFFCGDLEQIKALQAGHPKKIAETEERAIRKADPQMN